MPFSSIYFLHSSSRIILQRSIYNIFVAIFDEIETVISSKRLKFQFQTFYPFRSMFGMIKDEGLESSQNNGSVFG